MEQEKQKIIRCIGYKIKDGVRNKCRNKIRINKEEISLVDYFCCNEHKSKNIEDLMECCDMCGEEVNKLEEVIILKCNHAYHTNCIVTWFRTGNIKCPCCGHGGVNKKISGDHQGRAWRGWRLSKSNKSAKERYKQLVAYSKKEECPKTFKTIIAKHIILEKEIADLLYKQKHGKSEIDKKPYKEAANEIKTMRETIFKLKRRCNNSLDNILCYPIVPLIIPQKKKV